MISNLFILLIECTNTLKHRRWKQSRRGGGGAQIYYRSRFKVGGLKYTIETGLRLGGSNILQKQV